MKVIRLLPILLGLFALTGCSFSLAADVTPPPGMPQSAAPQPQPQAISQAFPSSPPDPEAGKPIYAEKCAPCHGETGQGDGPNASQLPNPPAALGNPDFARRATPAQWFSVVTQGNMERFMPPFTSLSDSQRWDVVAYAFSLSAAPDAVAQGKDLYQASCARCHGDQGLGDGPDAAGLSKAPSSLADQALMAEKSGRRPLQGRQRGCSARYAGVCEPALRRPALGSGRLSAHLDLCCTRALPRRLPPLPCRVKPRSQKARRPR